MKMIRQISLPIFVLFALVAHSPAFGWSTGIGIIDNNVPKVVKDPTIILKNPVEALVDVVAKGGVPGIDKIYEKALPEQQREILNAVVTTGFVTSPLGPVGTILTLQVLVAPGPNQEMEVKDVPVRIANPPRTPKVWNVKADCLVQRGARIEAFLRDEIPDVSKMTKGDTLKVSAASCPGYNSEGSKSITYAEIVLQGISEDPTAVPGKEYKTYVVGQVVA